MYGPVSGVPDPRALPEHMVEGKQVVVPEVFERAPDDPDRIRVAAEFNLRIDRTDAHDGGR